MTEFTLPPPIMPISKKRFFSSSQHPSFQWFAPSVIQQKRMLSTGRLVDFSPISIKRPA
jgi:hypothetical protein